MPHQIVASTQTSFSRTVAAAAIGTWLAFAICPAVFAADGAQAAAAAKQAATKMEAYLHDIEKSQGQPDYSKPPVSEYFKAVFNADALAALSAPKAENLGWLLEWVVSSNQTYKAMIMFGTKDLTDLQAIGRNVLQHQEKIVPAMAFVLRLTARTTSTAPIYFNSLPPDQRTEARKEGIQKTNRGLILTRISASSIFNQFGRTL